MAAFKGQSAYSVDSKGRVAVPAKMRNVMNPEAKSTFVITRGFEKCIFAYPLDHWENEVEGQIQGLNKYQAETRKFVRLIMRWADESALDGQGRVTLPKPLMEFAGITDRALIIGAFDHLEIWNPDIFEQYLNEEADEYETLAEQVLGT